MAAEPARPYGRDMTSEHIVVRGEHVTLAVSPEGAEPQSLRDPGGHEYLWQAGPEWPRHATLLFPIICRVPDDTITVRGRQYPMPQHGFARDRTFDVVDADQSRASFVLVADEETREHYPYDFALAVTYEAEDLSVSITYDVENRGDVPMPFSLGFHPAFAWPLEPDARRTLHEVRFDKPEHGPYRRVVDNLLTEEEYSSLVGEDRRLGLTDAIFADGAVIMPSVVSRGLTYLASTGRGVRIEWDGFTGVTLWSKPGAGFVCLETWRGLPAPHDFAGDFLDKPGNAIAPVGERLRFSYRMTLL